jgi:predicted metal-dependent HD superfamily phosphohydrolase
MEALRKSWDALCDSGGLHGGAGLWEELAVRYAEPHRAYHDLRHLEQVVGLLESMQTSAELLFAAWFHDVVYQPGRADNEARSAALAADRLGRAGLAAGPIAQVCAAILATAMHRAEPRFAALLDADLAVLGAAPAEYAAYRAAIRREYAAAPEPAFRSGRLAFVRAMLARKVIYQTAECRARFEAAARRNLALERAGLEAPATGTAPCS